MLPPTRDIGNSIVLYREPQEDFIGLILENQDSYESSVEEAGIYLKLLGVDEELNVLDYIWSFGGARVFLSGSVMEPLTLEQAKSFGKKKEKVSF